MNIRARSVGVVSRYASSMTPAETAARRYIAAWMDPDPRERARLVEACFAEDGRIILRGAELRGRAALVEAIEAFVADPRRRTGCITEHIQEEGPRLRLRAGMDQPDRTRHSSEQENGEIDASGRIATIYSFVD